ncbi:MAG: hypothetical protein J6Y13_11130, partial [Treponema sp.]|nr:hypothetical protein [Treponema sp.]
PRKARQEAAVEIRTGNETLVARMRAMQPLLARAVLPEGGQEDSGAKPLIAAQELEAALSRLASCVEEFDIDGLDAVMKELDGYSFAPADAKFIGDVRTGVENVDFKQLKSLLSEWKAGKL